LKLKPQPIDLLLAAALAAQAPHAAEVFARIAGTTGPLAYVHGYAYAAALEGATFFFVRRRMNRWAYVFALASVAHNVAYYMQPGDLRYWASAAIVCLGLPLAIAAFSHESAGHPSPQPAKAAPVLDVVRPGKAQPAPLQTVTETIKVDRQAEILDAIHNGASTRAAVAKSVGVHASTIGRDVKGMLTTGMIHENGNGLEVIG